MMLDHFPGFPSLAETLQRVQNGRTIGWLQLWSNIAGSLYKEEEAAEKDD